MNNCGHAAVDVVHAAIGVLHESHLTGDSNRDRQSGKRPSASGTRGQFQLIAATRKQPSHSHNMLVTVHNLHCDLPSAIAHPPWRKTNAPRDRRLVSESSIRGCRPHPSTTAHDAAQWAIAKPPSTPWRNSQTPSATTTIYKPAGGAGRARALMPKSAARTPPAADTHDGRQNNENIMKIGNL